MKYGSAIALYAYSIWTAAAWGQAPAVGEPKGIASGVGVFAFSGDGQSVVYDGMLYDRHTAKARPILSAANWVLQATSASFDATYVSLTLSNAGAAAGQGVVAGPGAPQVLVCDTRTGKTTLVSESIEYGGPGDGASGEGCLSANGRYLCFTSRAMDLVRLRRNPDIARPGSLAYIVSGSVGGGGRGVYLHDRATRQSLLIGAMAEGDGCPSMSADGQTIAFSSTLMGNGAQGQVFTGAPSQVFVYDVRKSATNRISHPDESDQPANRPCGWPRTSSDGRYIVYDSTATNLVPGNTRTWRQVYLYDRQSCRTTRVSSDESGRDFPAGCDRPCISAHGRYVAYRVTVFADADIGIPKGGHGLFCDLKTGKRTWFGKYGEETNSNDLEVPGMSPDGRVLAATSSAMTVGGGTPLWLWDRSSTVAADVGPGDTDGVEPYDPDWQQYAHGEAPRFTVAYPTGWKQAAESAAPAILPSLKLTAVNSVSFSTQSAQGPLAESVWVYRSGSKLDLESVESAVKQNTKTPAGVLRRTEGDEAYIFEGSTEAGRTTWRSYLPVGDNLYVIELAVPEAAAPQCEVGYKHVLTTFEWVEPEK